MNMNYKKYKPYPAMQFNERTWPSKTIEKAPMWCSVDLRDGNQALPVPMGVTQKIEMFKLLKKMGFKDIEIGFPSASETEYRFLRTLIEEGLIDDDIRVQVLTQAREHLIRKTFEALKGVKQAVVHVYNSTSTLQRKVVFNKDMAEIKAIAVEGAALLKELAAEYPETDFTFEYSPESFTGTEVEYALEVCEAVLDIWQPTPEKKAILNLPATVEMATPNVYADQIEWFSTHLKNRESVLISLHAHNDRGTAVAATELALMAGADRVEGTLFGNGERTGNVDLISLAMNMFSQGINPELNIDDINEIVACYENTTGMTVHDRHPYAGNLVYTAFSGSHQDAINKGLKIYNEDGPEHWEVPYLPIDPMDIGRSYEAIIRINSQSGKGGIAYIIEEEFGYKIPKAMHPELSKPVQKVTDDTGKELLPQEIFDIFEREFLNLKAPIMLHKFNTSYLDDEEDNNVTIHAEIEQDGQTIKVEGVGNGPISAFFHGLQKAGFEGYKLTSYDEHAIEGDENAEAAAYIQLENAEGIRHFGAGRDQNINKASIRALISAMNRFA